tara:strand:- start:17887 stop:18009 length:123 start_codon:yes stop_codon:yes gene_type:complete
MLLVSVLRFVFLLKFQSSLSLVMTEAAVQLRLVLLLCAVR